MRVKAFIVFITLLFLIPSAFSSTTLKQGQVYEVSSKSVVVENIHSDVAKFNVDGIKNIIGIGEMKEINGVEILVESIFYVDQPEERTVNVVMSVAFYCGDGTCDTDHNETKNNCCEDCGCNSGYTCQDEVCKSAAQIQQEEQEEEEASADKCEKDSDCDDNDSLTEDICKSYPGKPNKCLNIPPICKTDIECDDQNSCTLDKCVNNDCSYTDVSGCSEEQEVKDEKEEEETVPESENQSEESQTEMIEIVREEKGFFSKIISFLFGWLK